VSLRATVKELDFPSDIVLIPSFFSNSPWRPQYPSTDPCYVSDYAPFAPLKAAFYRVRLNFSDIFSPPYNTPPPLQALQFLRFPTLFLKWKSSYGRLVPSVPPYQHLCISLRHVPVARSVATVHDKTIHFLVSTLHAATTFSARDPS